MIIQIALGKGKSSPDKEGESAAHEAGESGMVELVERSFCTRSLVHMVHLTTNSYASHMALGDLYDAIVDEIDDIAECFVGEFGPLCGLEIEAAKMPQDIIAYIKEEFAWIKAHRSDIANGSTVIENMLDGLSAKYSKALYKLTQLH